MPGVESTVVTPFGVAGLVPGRTLVTMPAGDTVCVLTGTTTTICVDASGMIVLDRRVLGATRTRMVAAPGTVEF